MFSQKLYLKILFSILFIISFSVMAYSYNFSKKFPLPIIDHISFDAKVKFVREKVDIDKIDTLIVGSSLGLNNIEGAELEDKSVKSNHVLNLSVWSIDATQVEQILGLVPIFPNLKRIIYSVQFTSFNFANQFKKFDIEFLKKYIKKDLNPLEYAHFVANACKDISFCRKREKEWKKKHLDNTIYSYLGFDHTGSTLLHIYGNDIIQSRWKKVDGATQHPNGLKALSRMAKKAQEENIKFYVVQQPYRQAQIDKYKHIQKIMVSFPKNMNAIIEKYQGKFLNLHDKMHLDDGYFADRSHLNDKGSKVVAIEVAKFIDKSEK